MLSLNAFFTLLFVFLHEIIISWQSSVPLVLSLNCMKMKDGRKTNILLFRNNF